MTDDIVGYTLHVVLFDLFSSNSSLPCLRVSDRIHVIRDARLRWEVRACEFSANLESLDSPVRERLCCLGLSRRGVVMGTPMLSTSKLLAGPDTEERRERRGW